MLCNEVIGVIEQACRKDAALDWDNVGLQVGRYDKEVQCIYVALDATDEVIEHAVKCKADMLLTHHPMIFSPLRTITDDDFIGRRVLKLVKSDISYYAAHTNYDVMRMAELSSGKLALRDEEVLEVTYAGPDGQQEGIGRIGQLQNTVGLAECCELVKEQFGLEHVTVFGELGHPIERVAISPGSGKSMIDIAVQKGADVLITGDIGHHEGIDAVARGLTIIDAGHYGLEHIFIADMKRYLEERLTGVKVVGEEIVNPFQII